jgi:hypothetical protein
MIRENTLLWRNVAEHSFLQVIVAAHSLASFAFLLSDQPLYIKVAVKREFFNKLLIESYQIKGLNRNRRTLWSISRFFTRWRMISALIWVLLGSVLTLVGIAAILRLTNKAIRDGDKREWQREMETERLLRNQE